MRKYSGIALSLKQKGLLFSEQPFNFARVENLCTAVGAEYEPGDRIVKKII
jgi:hypothetical protein